MSKLFITVAALGGMLSVALGAFGAHGLAPILSAKQFSTYQTAVHYQTIHSLALFMVGLLQLHHTARWFSYSGWTMIVGIGLFSGSLYLFVATGLKVFGMITPLGGVMLILAWLFLAIGTFNLKTTH